MNQLSIGRFPELDYACGEAMNTLCTNLFYCGENIRSVLLTSRYEQEGKVSLDGRRNISFQQVTLPPEFAL